MTMSTTDVLRSEWIKIRSVRAVSGSLMAVFLVTLAVTLLAFATVGQAEAEKAYAAARQVLTEEEISA
ncbi:hypothetical protein ACWCQX_17630, partial [Streptomyces sp. NPDC002346]